MKSSFKHALVAAASLAIAGAACAQTGTVNFTGSVSATTCTVTGQFGGTNANSINVTLPNVSATELSAAGKTAGITYFGVSVSNCTGPATQFYPYFLVSPQVDLATGALTNTATNTPATNVEVQVTDATGSSVININNQTAFHAPAVTINSSGLSTSNLAARYLATGAATAGNVASSVTYSIDYL